MPENPVIETGVDRLVRLIKKVKKISIVEAAKKLGVSTIVVEEWADFLEDEGVISIEYKFTTPYLVEREVTEKEMESKTADFGRKKEAFVRKAEVTLALIDKEAESLEHLRKEFDVLKKDLGDELKRLKFDVKDLERYEELKNTIAERILSQQSEFSKKMDELHKLISREERKYSEMIGEMSAEEKKLESEKVSALSLREKESALRQRLDTFREMIRKIEDSMEIDDREISESSAHVDRLKGLAEKIKGSIEEKRNELNRLVEESSQQEDRIGQMQKELLKKVSEKRNDIEDKIEKGKGASYAFMRFFEKKAKIERFIENLARQRDELEKDLLALIQKAKIFTLTAKTVGVSKHVDELKSSFDKIEKRKGIFESQIKKLGRLLE